MLSSMDTTGGRWLFGGVAGGLNGLPAKRNDDSKAATCVQTVKSVTGYRHGTNDRQEEKNKDGTGWRDRGITECKQNKRNILHFRHNHLQESRNRPAAMDNRGLDDEGIAEDGSTMAGLDSVALDQDDDDDDLMDNHRNRTVVIERLPPRLSQVSNSPRDRSLLWSRSRSMGRIPEEPSSSLMLDTIRHNCVMERQRRKSRRLTQRRFSLATAAAAAAAAADDDDDDDEQDRNVAQSTGRHRAWRRASLSQMVDTTATLADALKHECLDVRDGFVNELRHACDRCDAHILNMSMTRTVALPPLQIDEVVWQFQNAVGMSSSENRSEGEGADENLPIHGLDNSLESIPDEDYANVDSDRMGNGLDTPLMLHDHDKTSPDLTTGRATVPTVPKRNRPWYAYPLLAAAVLALSSIGPASGLMTGTIPFLGAFWRLTGTSIVMMPLALRVLTGQTCPDHDSLLGCPFHEQRQQEAWRGALGWSWTSWLTAALAALAYVALGIAFAFACRYTTLCNVLIFGNSQSILLFLGKAIYGKKVAFLEGFGVITAIAGAILCSTDSDQQAQEKDPNYSPYNTLVGDGLALLAGIAGVVYLASANALRDKVDIIVYVPLNMMIGAWIVLGYITVVLGQNIAFTLDPHEGLFGWLQPTPTRLWLELYIILGCSVFGTFGYIQSMRYFDNLVVSSACLLEPMIATVMAYALGGKYLPGMVGWIGNILVVVGTIAVIHPSVQKTKTLDQQ